MRDMKLLTQSGVGRQAARISQATDKSQLKFSNNALAALALLATIAVSFGLSACAGYTSAASQVTSQDPKTGVLSAGAGSLSFGSVSVGSTSTAQSVTLTNTGTGAVNVSQATISGAGFTVVGASPSGSVAVGQSVTVQIQFAPQSAGAASGTFTVTSNASNSPASVALTGMGAQPGVSVAPLSLSFGSVNVGGSASQNVTVTNSSSAIITISGATATGAGITVNGVFPQTLNAGANTTLEVQFAPAVSGNVSGSVSIADTAPGSPTIVAVSGTGVQAEIAASPSSVSFGNVATGNTNSQPIQISNGGNATLTISQITMTGGGNGFSTILSTPLAIQPGKSASFNVTFTPSSTGTFSGSISLVSNAPNSPLTINLTGTGVVTTRTLSASTSSVSFGNVNDGTNSSQNVTLTNTGNSNVTISSVGATGTGFSVSGVQTGLDAHAQSDGDSDGIVRSELSGGGEWQRHSNEQRDEFSSIDRVIGDRRGGYSAFCRVVVDCQRNSRRGGLLRLPRHDVRNVHTNLIVNGRQHVLHGFERHIGTGHHVLLRGDGSGR